MTIGQNNLEAIDWPPTGNDPNYGAQLMFDSFVNGSSTVGATQHGQLYINTSSSTSYQLRHLIALPMSYLASSTVCPLLEGSFTLRQLVHETDVRMGPHLLRRSLRIRPVTTVENTCPTFDPISTDPSNEWVWGCWTTTS